MLADIMFIKMSVRHYSSFDTQALSASPGLTGRTFELYSLLLLGIETEMSLEGPCDECQLFLPLQVCVSVCV